MKKYKYYSGNFGGGVMGNVHELVAHLNEHHPERDVIHIERNVNCTIYVWREEVDVEGRGQQPTCPACGTRVPQDQDRVGMEYLSPEPERETVCSGAGADGSSANIREGACGGSELEEDSSLGLMDGCDELERRLDRLVEGGGLAVGEMALMVGGSAVGIPVMGALMHASEVLRGDSGERVHVGLRSDYTLEEMERIVRICDDLGLRMVLWPGTSVCGVMLKVKE